MEFVTDAETTTPDPAYESLTLRHRAPAYAVMQEALRVQAGAKPLGRSAQFFGRSPLHPDARSWYLGAIGEIAVARELAKLGEGWHVLHAVPVGSGDADIDHVVVGPGGVFTINSKHHGEKRVFVGGNAMKINGQDTDHIRNSRYEARRAARLLSAATGSPIEVTPIIVVVGAAEVKFGKKRPAVEILQPKLVRRWFQKRKRVLPDAAVDTIMAVAEQRATWHTTTIDHADSLRHAHRFDRLREEVRAAHNRRKAWSLAGIVAVIVAGVASLPPLVLLLLDSLAAR